MPLGAGDRVCGDHRPHLGDYLLTRGGVFAHVHVAGLDPEGVVDDAVHDGVGVDSGAEPLVPVLLGVLGAEHGGGVSVASLEELEQQSA